LLKRSFTNWVIPLTCATAGIIPALCIIVEA
jgi:hypothetical protein